MEEIRCGHLSMLIGVDLRLQLTVMLENTSREKVPFGCCSGPHVLGQPICELNAAAVAVCQPDAEQLLGQCMSTCQRVPLCRPR